MAEEAVGRGVPVCSVVVPAYNEDEGIDEFHRRVTQVLSGLGEPYEIVYVDDGSSDGTWSRLSAIAHDDPHVRLVRFSRNFGHQNAISAGCAYALGDAVVTIDSDLQDPPELIPQMLDRWRGGADVVYAVRSHRRGETRFKKASAAAFYRLMRRIADVDIPVDVGDFRLMSRRANAALGAMPEHHRYVRGMVAWLGYPTDTVEYVRDPRVAGETKYPLRRMVGFALDGVVGFSIRPLRIATWMGIAASLTAVIAAVGLIIARIVGLMPVVEGWTSLVVVVLLLAGVQLFTIGALGEYVGRIYAETQGRPLYVVSEVVGERTGGLG